MRHYLLALLLASISSIPAFVYAIPETPGGTIFDVVGCTGDYVIDANGASPTFTVDCANNEVEISTLTVRETITANSFIGPISSSSTITVNGLIIQGSTDTVSLQTLISCPTGKGTCAWSNIDNGDLYISTGSAVGQFKNARTGTGP